MVEKKYDIIVHGATGFTGGLICDYLSTHLDVKSIKWGISGRNNKKIEDLWYFYVAKISHLTKKSFKNLQ